MSNAKKKFDKAAQPSAVDQVMKILLDDQEDAPKALLKQAVKEGLASRFSFIVYNYDEIECADPSERLFAVIYPTEKDVTFKCPSFIAPLVPEANDVDDCCETQWFFPKEFDTPAKIAQRLSEIGLVWDKELQKDDPVYDEVKDALEGKAAKQALARPKKPGK